MTHFVRHQQKAKSNKQTALASNTHFAFHFLHLAPLPGGGAS